MTSLPQVSIAGSEDAPNEAPRFEAAQSGGSLERFKAADGGYFQLCHSVFRDPKLRDLPGDAFRLYLWLSSQGWRFRDSDGSLRASVSFITEATGMPHATVSRALKPLREVRLIELLETDFKRGNRWRVTPRAAWNISGGKGPQREVPQTKSRFRLRRHRRLLCARIGARGWIWRSRPAVPLTIGFSFQGDWRDHACGSRFGDASIRSDWSATDAGRRSGVVAPRTKNARPQLQPSRSKLSKTSSQSRGGS